MRLTRIAVALLVLGLLLGLALSQVLRDVTPPELFLDVAESAPSGLPLEIFVSASEPVRYRLDYGGVVIEEVSQDLRASLLAEPGAVPLTVRAEDGAGNVATARIVVVGIAPPEPELIARREVLPGQPLAVRLDWREHDGASVVSRSLSADGVPLTLHGPGSGGFALLAVPLGTEPGAVAFEASVEDGFGRRIGTDLTVTVLPDPQPIEELNLPASVLAVSTPEGRELERRTLEAVFARPPQEPLWSEPFVLPIEGRGTSGFGSPRRYAPGGRVSYHYGSDLAAPAGTPILATNEGVVVVADFFPIKGGLVIVDHGAGLTSLYFHQSRILVSVGERVARGQPLGEVGSTGLSSGPHLHWEMRVAGVPTDPHAWLGQVLPLASPGDAAAAFALETSP